jgi:hypothetical protein
MPCETSCPLQGGAGYALFERVHEVHDVLAARTWFGGDGLAAALSNDELRQSLFVVVLELLRLEHAGLLIDDMLREVEHILRNFHVLDLVEVFFFVSDFVGVSKERPHMLRMVSRITAKASCPTLPSGRR